MQSDLTREGPDVRVDTEKMIAEISLLTDIKKELLQIENRLKSRIDELISQVNAN